MDFTWAIDLVKTQGLAGVGLVIMALAVKTLFKELQDSQKARITEAGESKTAIERNTAALDALKEVIRSRRG